MKRKRNLSVKTAALLFVALLLASCQQTGKGGKTLTLAINSGVEGDALKQAAIDYEAQTGVHINIAEFPYANLFEKELIDLNARTGAYDLIMLEDDVCLCETWAREDRGARAGRFSC